MPVHQSFSLNHWRSSRPSILTRRPSANLSFQYWWPILLLSLLDTHTSPFLFPLFSSWPGCHHIIPRAISMDPIPSILFLNLPWWCSPALDTPDWSPLPRTLPHLSSISFPDVPSLTLPPLRLQYIYQPLYSHVSFLSFLTFLLCTHKASILLALPCRP